MAKKNKQHKAANGGSAEQSPEGVTKKVQVGQTPGSNTSSPVVAEDRKKDASPSKSQQQAADAHVDMKEASGALQLRSVRSTDGVG